MEKNKIGKYLKYAIGEILLVVIGILIALQINNWNENRKQIDQEIAFLHQVKEDLKISEKRLGEAVEFFEERTLSAVYITKGFWRPSSIKNDTLEKRIVVAASSQRIRPVLGTIESLVSSGNINLIRSDSIRSKLTDYLDYVKALLSDIERYDETYYRPGMAQIQEEININEAIQKFRGASDYSSVPDQIEINPFPNNFNTFFNNRKLFSAYNNMLVAYRNQFYNYDDILRETTNLKIDVEHYLSTHD